MGSLWAHTGAIGCIVLIAYTGMYVYVQYQNSKDY